MSKANDLVDPHVATDHAVGQARLKRLVYDAAIEREISLAARYEVAEAHFLRQAPAACGQHTHRANFADRSGQQLNLPDALTGLAAVLFEHPCACRLEPWRERLPEVGHGAVDVGVRPPAEMLRAVQDLLRPHFEDHVGMGAD